jgi:TfoX/Sxy family transcriptional regulator of competence genes
MVSPLKWKKPSEGIVRFFEEKAADIKCEKRSMFGYPCAFINNNMFFGTFEDNIFLRLGEAGSKKAMAADNDITAFEPRPGRRMAQYVVVPQKVRNDPRLFERLLAQSVKYASSLPVKERRKRVSKT